MIKDIKIKVELDMGNIAKLAQSAKDTMPMFMDALSTEINTAQVLPRDTGELADSVFTDSHDGMGFIGWNTPYARRLFYHPEYNFRKDKHVNAQGRWTDPFTRGPYLPTLERIYAQLWKRQAGGLIK